MFLLKLVSTFLCRVFFNNPGEIAVIGANVMTGYEVLFDTEGSARIGFAMSDCNYTRIVESASQQGFSNGTHFPTKPPSKIPTYSIGSKNPITKPSAWPSARPSTRPTAKPTTRITRKPTGKEKSTSKPSTRSAANSSGYKFAWIHVLSLSAGLTAFLVFTLSFL